MGHCNPPTPANENLKILSEGGNPWTALVACRKAILEMVAEHRKNGFLLRDPLAMARLKELRAFEACLRWHYFRRR